MKENGRPQGRFLGIAPMHPLHRALFEPRRIALIGASADRDAADRAGQLYLRKHGYAG